MPTRSPDHLRTRTTRLLFAGGALGTTGLFAAITAGPLIAHELAGEAWAGFPATAVTIGTAAGTSFIAAYMARHGRRPGLVLGYAVGALGAAAVVASAAAGSFPFLIAGALVLGVGHGSNQLARYTAADMHPPERRAGAVGFVVWAGTVGALAGPNLLAASGRLAGAFGLPALSGPFLVTLITFVCAGALYMTLLRPDPATLAVGHDPSLPQPVSTGSVWRVPSVQAAVAALVTGQVVMVFIMTMTPIHLRQHDHGLTTVGFVASMHVVGMYAFSPVAGRLGNRLGALPVIVAGQFLLAAAGVTAAISPPANGTLLAAPLFLLGLGWSCSFVGGSTLLTRDLPYAARARLQGTADSLTWGSAAAAALGSGLVLSSVGYPALCLIGAASCAVPLVVLAGRRAKLATA